MDRHNIVFLGALFITIVAILPIVSQDTFAWPLGPSRPVETTSQSLRLSVENNRVHKFKNNVHQSRHSNEVNYRQGSSGQEPVVFVPGDGGSQLEAKLNKTSRIHYICDLVSDWYDLWLNIHLLAPVVFDCFSDNMRLHYDKKTRTTKNTEGVEVRATNFGSLESVDYLDIYHLYGTDYFETIIATLEKGNGLIRNVDMVGAAFDFRKAPNELADYFKNLTLLIEEHYAKNNYKPVTLICHSMGCLNSVYLLNSKSDSWKKVHIRRLISLGAPWSGSFKAISAMLYGDNLGIPLLNKYKLQSLQSSFPSLMYLFPRGPAFPDDRLLVKTPEENYTLKNLDRMFEKAGLLDQKEMWHDTKAIADSLTAPNVELWCLFGTGIDTPSKIIYSGPIDSGKYEEIQGDGDGTVNVESLRACDMFKDKQKEPVYLVPLSGVDHIAILRGKDAANFISEKILGNDHIH